MPSGNPGTGSAKSWLHALEHTPRSAHEALSLYVHALLLHHGFRPSGTPSGSSSSSGAPSAPTLPPGWGDGGYGGRYRHTRSAMEYEVRGVPLGGRLLVNATAVEEDGVTHTLDIRTEDYIRAGTRFGVDNASRNDADEDTRHAHWTDAILRADDLATLVQVNIAHRLVPDSAKDGYEDAVAARNEESNRQGASGSGAGAAPLPQPYPRGIVPPAPGGYDDPLMIGPPRVPHYPGPVPGVPAPFGRDDLLPPPFANGPDRMPGFLPMGGGGMGGNLMGPRNFPRPGNPDTGIGGPRLPRGAVPPGARFDPFGPPVPGNMPRNPDNDIERPPPDGDDDGPPPGMYW